jgi:hypothetical protein
MIASPPNLAIAMANKFHISASQQWQLANLTRQKVSLEAHSKEPNLRRLVGLCNTLDTYSSKLEEIHSARRIPSYHDTSIDDDSEDSGDEQENADYGEGEVLEWFGDFGDEDAPIPMSEGEKDVEVNVLECDENDSEDSDSCEEDSDGSSWGDEDEEQYFSDSSVEEEGAKEKD